MKSPYSNMEPRQSWRKGVSEQHPFSITDLYRKKFDIASAMKICTAGSCFAQHLRTAGYRVMDAEPAPRIMNDTTAHNFGYRIYSGRYGNIYLVEQLLQIVKEAYGLFTPAMPVWEKEGRYYDAMRPSVEPNGLASSEEVMAHRAEHLKNVRAMFESMDLFIFTMGLTEGWVHTQTRTTYPTAPGTIAGDYDPDVFHFKNFRASEIRASLEEVRTLIKKHNPDVKFLLTVSPVPLTATASTQHVLPATTYSKSVLRSVAGEMSEDFDDIDYFPSVKKPCWKRLPNEGAVPRSVAQYGSGRRCYPDVAAG